MGRHRGVPPKSGHCLMKVEAVPHKIDEFFLNLAALNPLSELVQTRRISDEASGHAISGLIGPAQTGTVRLHSYGA